MPGPSTVVTTPDPASPGVGRGVAQYQPRRRPADPTRARAGQARPSQGEQPGVRGAGGRGRQLGHRCPRGRGGGQPGSRRDQGLGQRAGAVSAGGAVVTAGVAGAARRAAGAGRRVCRILHEHGAVGGSLGTGNQCGGGDRERRLVGVAVGESVGLGVGGSVGVAVGVSVGVGVGLPGERGRGAGRVAVGVPVGVGDGVTVGVTVGVAHSSSRTAREPPRPTIRRGAGVRASGAQTATVTQLRRSPACLPRPPLQPPGPGPDHAPRRPGRRTGLVVGSPWAPGLSRGVTGRPGPSGRPCVSRGRARPPPRWRG